jgi:hypothetical protein
MAPLQMAFFTVTETSQAVVSQFEQSSCKLSVAKCLPFHCPIYVAEGNQQKHTGSSTAQTCNVISF